MRKILLLILLRETLWMNKNIKTYSGSGPVFHPRPKSKMAVAAILDFVIFYQTTSSYIFLMYFGSENTLMCFFFVIWGQFNPVEHVKGPFLRFWIICLYFCKLRHPKHTYFYIKKNWGIVFCLKSSLLSKNVL